MKRLLHLIISYIIGFGIFARRGGVDPLDDGQLPVNFGDGIAKAGIPAYVSLDIALHKDITLTQEVHVRFPFPKHSFGSAVLDKADYHWDCLIGDEPRTYIRNRLWDYFRIDKALKELNALSVELGEEILSKINS